MSDIKFYLLYFWPLLSWILGLAFMSYVFPWLHKRMEKRLKEMYDKS